MKKFIYTAAAAAALGLAGQAQAVTFEVNNDTSFSVYGNLQYTYINRDYGAYDSSQLADNGSTIGVLYNHDWNNGLSTYVRAEFQFIADQKKALTSDYGAGTAGISTTDEVYGGVKGSFGEVRLGTWDGIFQDNVADYINIFEVGVWNEFNGSSEAGNQIAYFSPNFGGFSFAVQASVAGDGERENFDQTNTDPYDGDVALSAVASYSADIFTVNLAYTDQGHNENLAANKPDDTGSNIALSASVDLDPFTLAGVVKSVGEDDGTDNGGMIYAIRGSYNYGPGSVSLAVRQLEWDSVSQIESRGTIKGASDSQTQFFGNVTYNVTPDLYVYAEAGFSDNDAAGPTEGLYDYQAVGAVWLF